MNSQEERKYPREAVERAPAVAPAAGTVPSPVGVEALGTAVFLSGMFSFPAWFPQDLNVFSDKLCLSYSLRVYFHTKNIDSVVIWM